jgi:hypothetical protein
LEICMIQDHFFRRVLLGKSDGKNSFFMNL